MTTVMRQKSDLSQSNFIFKFLKNIFELLVSHCVLLKNAEHMEIFYDTLQHVLGMFFRTPFKLCQACFQDTLQHVLGMFFMTPFKLCQACFYDTLQHVLGMFLGHPVACVRYVLGHPLNCVRHVFMTPFSMCQTCFQDTLQHVLGMILGPFFNLFILTLTLRKTCFCYLQCLCSHQKGPMQIRRSSN